VSIEGFFCFGVSVCLGIAVWALLSTLDDPDPWDAGT
jgi:hypothetical protein